jgi:hypothetical protein
VLAIVLETFLDYTHTHTHAHTHTNTHTHTHTHKRLRYSRGSVLTLVSKFVGSNPAEAIGFLRSKISTARLPSEGK